ncbi:MAG TPA: hypothetical protein VE866_08390 [Candidatus Binatia bacterium]|jgi:hypothetical protein|nr:hypothetical protein [Candidatus Binatia bacterium]
MSRVTDEIELQRKAAAALVGKRVRFAHDSDRPENYFYVTLARNGMVELEGMAGEFAPQLFIVQGSRP